MTKEEAIKILDDYEIVPMDFPYNTREEVRQAFCMAIDALNALPSVDRPSGHWVLVNRGLDIYMCDRCGEILQIDSVPIWDYCPLCGARMGGETERSSE